MIFTLIGFAVMFYLAYKEFIEPRKKQHQKLRDKHNIVYDDIDMDQYVKGYEGDMFISAEDKQSYMHSDKWKDMKKRRIYIARNKCEVKGCNETDDLQLHHINYEHLGDEDIADLRIVCAKHHQQIHDIAEKLYKDDGFNGYSRTNTYPLSLL